MGETRRRVDLFKSHAEIRAETLRRVTQKGRATIAEASVILGWSHRRVSDHISRDQIQTLRMGKRELITLEELERAGKEYGYNTANRW